MTSRRAAYSPFLGTSEVDHEENEWWHRREISLIQNLLAERGETDKTTIGEELGCKYWGPTRFTQALEVGVELNAFRKVGHHQYAPNGAPAVGGADRSPGRLVDSSTCRPGDSSTPAPLVSRAAAPAVAGRAAATRPDEPSSSGDDAVTRAGGGSTSPRTSDAGTGAPRASRAMRLDARSGRALLNSSRFPCSAPGSVVPPA
ncbi:hypothetical protein ACI789_16805 [Geodermatophilus sp. SYSU D00965]